MHSQHGERYVALNSKWSILLAFMVLAASVSHQATAKCEELADLRVLPFEPKHFEQVQAIEADVSTPERTLHFSMLADSDPRRLNPFTLVATIPHGNDELVVGYLYVDPHHDRQLWSIEGIGVLKDLQGRGIGTALLNHLAEEAKAYAQSWSKLEWDIDSTFMKSEVSAGRFFLRRQFEMLHRDARVEKHRSHAPAYHVTRRIRAGVLPPVDRSLHLMCPLLRTPFDWMHSPSEILPIAIQPMAAEDVDFAMQIERDNFGHSNYPRRLPFHAATRSRPRALPATFDAWKAISPEEPTLPSVGHYVVQLTGRKLTVVRFAVHPKALGRGVEFQMVEQLKRRLLLSVFNTLELHVHADDMPLRRLLKENGFKEIGYVSESHVTYSFSRPTRQDMRLP